MTELERRRLAARTCLDLLEATELREGVTSPQVRALRVRLDDLYVAVAQEVVGRRR